MTEPTWPLLTWIFPFKAIPSHEAIERENFCLSLVSQLSSPHRTSSHLPLTTLDQFSKILTIDMLSHFCALDATVSVPQVDSMLPHQIAYIIPQTILPIPFKLASLVGHKVYHAYSHSYDSFFFPHLEYQPSLSVYPAFRFFPLKTFCSNFNFLTDLPKSNILGFIRKLNTWLHQTLYFSSIIS